MKSTFNVLRYDKSLFLKLLKLTFSLVRYDLKLAFSLFRNSLESINSVIDYEKEGVKSLITETESKLINKERKLFILGSGPSINLINDYEWRLIKQYDSMGFNLWFCHPFVPNIYVVQSLPESEGNSFSTSLNLELKTMLNDKREAYKNVRFYARGDAANKNKFYSNVFGRYLKDNFKENLYHFSELIVASYSSIYPSILLNKMNLYGFFNKQNTIQSIPKFGSTIGELISLSLIMGYKEIILCGIDMNDGGHFYDSESYFKQYPYLREIYKINHSHKNRKHEHMDTVTRPYTVKDYIVSLNEFAQTNFNAEIFVLNTDSALYPEIKKYNDEDL